MKVLIVSGNYYPVLSPRSFRTTELARETVRQGHRVSVYIPEIPESKMDYKGELSDYGVEVKQFSKNRFKKININYPYFGKLFHKINRLLDLLFEYPMIELFFKVKNTLKKEQEQYDLIISIAYPYPIHWGVARAISKKPDLCKRWIADCGDPYMGATIETFRKPFYFKYVEKWFCRKADYLSVPTVGAIDGYYPEFKDKIRVIPQGFRMDTIKLSSEKVCNKVPTFAYAGGISFGVRNPLPLLDYLIETDKTFKFVIYTNQKELLINYKRRIGDVLDIRDYVEREILLFELSKMDFLLNLDNGTTRQSPSKLIEYAISGRPVLNLNVQNLNKELIDEFIKGDYRNALKMPNKEDYNIVNVTKKILNLAL